MSPKPEEKSTVPRPEDSAVKPIEDAGTLHTSLMITFLLSCLYFCITVTSTTHRLLLLGGTLKLPLLDVSIPLEGFYVVAPAVILCLHVYLMLQYHVLVRRLLDPLTSRLGNDVDYFLFPSVPVLRHVLREEEPWVSRLIRLGLMLINVALPVLALCLAQYYFLPYHSFLITLWHQTLIVLDLFVIWYFFITVRSHFIETKLLGRRVLTMVGFIGLVSFYSFFLAIVPGTWFEFFTSRSFDLPSWFQRNLKIPDQLLISEEPSQEVIAAFVDKNAKSSRDSAIYLRFAVGARLQGRDLRYADLEEAKLFNADLRGADLRHAKLVGADLSGANLNPQEHITLLRQVRSARKSETIAHLLENGDFKPTRLDDANLYGANFEGATLILASMVHTDLQGANLDGLELTGADLTEARLSSAWLAGSELSHVKLDGAALRNTHLEGATLDYASLAGARMAQVEAQAASFVKANLEGAQLAEANLRTASFRDARLSGSDLRRAYLQGVSALDIESTDLRGSHLGAACDVQFKTLSDLRFVDFTLPTPADWKNWRNSIEDRIKSLSRSETQREREIVLTRFDNASRHIPAQGAIEAQAACIGTPHGAEAPNRNNRLLYLDEERVGVLENWPPLEHQNHGKAWDEAVFQRDLAADLLSRICKNSGVARSIALRAAQEYAPGDEAFDLELAKQVLSKLKDLQRCSALQEFLDDQRREPNGIDLSRQILWRVRKDRASN
ncbi:MAG TPA: pentapeptide repeat-containing protein [Thermoanaerobaculia bacterium]|nr:pentapeptide repeat-containing protein [Thermoanaerobaculia bacterium]